MKNRLTGEKPGKPGIPVIVPVLFILIFAVVFAFVRFKNTPQNSSAYIKQPAAERSWMKSVKDKDEDGSSGVSRLTSRKLEEGEKLFNEGNYDAASETFLSVLEKDPGSKPSVYRWMTRICIRMHRFDEAHKYIDQAIAAEPKNPSNYLYKGDVYFADSDYELALEQYDKMKKLSPESAVPFYAVSRSCLELHEGKEALDNIKKALEIEPENPAYLMALSSSYQILKEKDKAVEALRKIVEKDPEFAEAYSELGSILVSQAKYEDAVKYANLAVETALKRKPGEEKSLKLKSLDMLKTDRSKVFSDMARHRESLADLDDVLSKNPDFIPALREKGAIMSDLANFEESIKCFRRIERLNPNANWRYNYMAFAFHEKGDLENAKKYASLHLEEFDEPRSATDWSKMGVNNAILGNYEKAVTYAKKAIEIDPDFKLNIVNLAIIYTWMGEYDRAKEVIDRAYGMKPFEHEKVIIERYRKIIYEKTASR